MRNILRLYNIAFFIVFIPVAIIYVLSKIRKIKAIAAEQAETGNTSIADMMAKTTALFQNAESIMPNIYIKTFFSTLVYTSVLKYFGVW